MNMIYHVDDVDYVYEIDNSDIINWIMETKGKEEIVQLMDEGFYRANQRSKKIIIDSLQEFADDVNDWGKIFKQGWYKDDKGEVDFNKVYDKLTQEGLTEVIQEILEEVGFNAIDLIEDEIRDEWESQAISEIEDELAYDRDPYAYNGLSRNDF